MSYRAKETVLALKLDQILPEALRELARLAFQRPLLDLTHP